MTGFLLITPLMQLAKFPFLKVVFVHVLFMSTRNVGSGEELLFNNCNGSWCNLEGLW